MDGSSIILHSALCKSCHRRALDYQLQTASRLVSNPQLVSRYRSRDAQLCVNRTWVLTKVFTARCANIVHCCGLQTLDSVGVFPLPSYPHKYRERHPRVYSLCCRGARSRVCISMVKTNRESRRGGWVKIGRRPASGNILRELVRLCIPKPKTAMLSVSGGSTCRRQ